ncbi:MAG TPA: NUDIX domain-containing protein [Candidatus Dormibacteraeota bacterium]
MTDMANAAPTPASTVALLRDVDGGVEVCMLRRPGRSSFAAGAFVFPGGAVDAADGTGPEAYRVAGVREVLEEVGLLIGGAASGTRDNDLDARIGAARAQVLAGVKLTDALAEHGLVTTPGDLVYIAHFITPPREGRRYDTRFFAMRVGAQQLVNVHAAEAVEGGWHRPEAMLPLRIPAIMPPTRMLCHEFARLGSVDAILTTLGERPVEVTDITPEIIAGWMALE